MITCSTPIAKVMITCPGRGYRNRFSRLMEQMGFELNAIPMAFSEDESAPYRGRLLSYRRGL